MLLNYFKFAIRVLIRNPFFTLINVFGLSLGFVVFFLLWEHTRSELSSDQHHPAYERIYRVVANWHWTDDGSHWEFSRVGTVGPKMSYELNKAYSEIEDYTRILYQPQFIDELTGHGDRIILSREKNGSRILFRETKAAYADDNVFTFFFIPLLYGDGSSALTEDKSIVLSHHTSRKYFGNENPVGQLLILNGNQPLKVTGVFHDLPNNTHLDFDFIISNASLKNRWNNYIWAGGHNFVRLNETADAGRFSEEIRSQTNKYWAENFRQIPDAKAEMFLQPLQEVAFSDDFFGDYFKPKSRFMLIVLSTVSVLVLCMAWINYVNLTLSRTAGRMKEIGTRRVVGARASDLIKQFVAESIVIHIFSIGIALTFLQIVDQSAQIYLQIPLPTQSRFSDSSIIFFLVISLAGVFLTGFYPAFLTITHSTRALFSSGAKFSSPRWFSGVLTTFQYTIAIVLILCMLVMVHQLQFIFGKARPTGTKVVAVIESPVVRKGEFPAQMEYFKNQIIAHALCEDATLCKSIAGVAFTNNDILFLKKNVSSGSIGFDSNGGVNERFIPFFGTRILSGRNFRNDDRPDVIILSRIAANRLGYANPDAAVGEKLSISHSGTWQWKEVEIIGVIEDYRIRPYFDFGSSFEDNGGRGICLTYKDVLLPQLTPERIVVKIDVNDLAKSISGIEKQYAEIFPGNVFNHYFLADHINRHYDNDRISRNQVICFTGIAIGIACLGLLGMISNQLTKKAKEIGIRKVLGASMKQIYHVLLAGTAKHFLVAAAVGIPLGYYLTNQYLMRFSERITIQWWHIAIPLLALLAIMFAVIAKVLWRAARANPIESLRYE